MTRASLRRRVFRKGQRGRPKGEGGRPALKLYNDPDRMIVVSALRLGSDPQEQRSLAILQALDFLLTEYDSIEVELGTCVRHGVERGRLSLINTEPPRAPSANFPPDRQPLSAPGRRAFRRSRLRLLRDKVDRYGRASRANELGKREVWFRDLSFLAFDFITNGRWLEAGLVLQKIGWEMNESTRARLAEILSNPPIDALETLEVSIG
jgi:hypothetical protein